MIVDYYSRQIVCLSFARGKTHDFALFKREALGFSPDLACAVDSGFQGIQDHHKRAYCPKKASKHRPLTPNHRAYNRVLASYRIVVENIIRCLKVFRILSSVYRNHRRRFGLRFSLIAGIYNRDLLLKANL